MEQRRVQGKHVVTTEVLRGQGTTCAGTVEIEIRGPKGAGKALIAKQIKNFVGTSVLDQVAVKVIAAR